MSPATVDTTCGLYALQVVRRTAGMTIRDTHRRFDRLAEEHRGVQPSTIPSGWGLFLVWEYRVLLGSAEVDFDAEQRDRVVVGELANDDHCPHEAATGDEIAVVIPFGIQLE